MNNSLIFDSLLSGSYTPFITEWNIPYPYYPNGQNFTLPLSTGYKYDFYVDWGDGSEIEYFVFGIVDNPIVVHPYSSAGVYQVSISGLCERWSSTFFGHPPSESAYLLRVIQWGSIGLVSSASMFEGCTNLESIPVDPVWSDIVNFARCFYSNTSLIGNAPELWLRIPEPSGNDCFYDCELLDNYDDIPVDWK